ncbi:Protein kinase [uncultured virus]|nr:Protein kinase [uncultured virus]
MEEAKETKLGDLVLGATLGSGSFGMVREITDTGVVKAVKSFIPRKHTLDNIIGVEFPTELDAYCRLAHPNLMAADRLLIENGQIHIVMPLMQTNATEWADEKKRSLADLISVIHQTACAADFLLSQKLFNGDIRPDNVLIRETKEGIQAKITDFGSLLRIDGRHIPVHPLYSISIPEFLSPENLHAMVSGRGVAYSEKDVVWQLGMLIMSLVGETLPPRGEDDELADKAVLQWNERWLTEIGQRKHTLKTFFERDDAGSLIELTAGMLDPEVKQRFTMAQVLAHPVFKGKVVPQGTMLAAPLLKRVDCPMSIQRVTDFFVVVNDYNGDTGGILFAVVDLIYRSIGLLDKPSRQDVLAHNFACIYLGIKLYRNQLMKDNIYLFNRVRREPSVVLQYFQRFGVSVDDVLKMELWLIAALRGYLYRPYIFDSFTDSTVLLEAMDKVVPHPELYYEAEATLSVKGEATDAKPNIHDFIATRAIIL